MYNFLLHYMTLVLFSFSDFNYYAFLLNAVLHAF